MKESFTPLEIRNSIRKQKFLTGFTLIELIVVIAIIAILTAIIAPNAFRAIEKAKISSTISNFKTIKSATMSYYADCGQWPQGDIATTNPNSNDIANETQIFITGENQPSGWDGPYLEKWPQNYFSVSGHTYSDQRYSKYVHDCHPNPLTENPGEGIVYLQVGVFPENVAQKIKRHLDGTDDFGNDNGAGYGDTPGSIRWHFAEQYLFYVITYEASCP